MSEEANNFELNLESYKLSRITFIDNELDILPEHWQIKVAQLMLSEFVNDITMTGITSPMKVGGHND
jgi:hypothetical protein